MLALALHGASQRLRLIENIARPARKNRSTAKVSVQNRDYSAGDALGIAGCGQSEPHAQAFALPVYAT